MIFQKRKKVKLSDLVAPSFYSVYKDIKKNRYTHYWLKGGRGSTKSTFAALAIVQGIMRDGNNGLLSNAIIIRRYANTLSGSVVEQIKWAIGMLGQSHLWNIPQAKLEITYLPTRQKILFKGADDEDKLKSSKVSQGYFKYIWYEELVQFEGMEKIRSINQSLMRGGQDFILLYTYNPPKSSRSWVNAEALKPNKDKLVHHSTYLTVPREWLGEPFILEAEHLEKVNNGSYRHEYLGEETGTGLEIFTNLTVREISDDEINQFDNIRQGVDFGYSIDPVTFVKLHYDNTRKKLYIFKEFGGIQISNKKLYESIKDNIDSITIGDSAEPKSIAELQGYGFNIKGAKKGPDSIDYGIKFLSETIEEIIIDGERCPNTMKQFINYSLDVDRNGDPIAKYPDKEDDYIDAVRYAMEDDMRNSKVKILNRNLLF